MRFKDQKSSLTFPTPISDEEKKLNRIFLFPLFWGASKGFMKALQAFIKNFLPHAKEVRKEKFKLILT